MKKSIAVLLSAFFALLFLSVSVYAGGSVPVPVPVPVTAPVTAPVSEEPKREPVPFTVTAAETDDFQPENEYSITFLKEITIKAESVKGAKVTLTVTSGAEPEAEPKVYEEVIIGPTRKYIQPVALELGDNLIELTAEKEGFETTSAQYVIKRKDVNILESLQNLIVIPGRIK